MSVFYNCARTCQPISPYQGHGWESSRDSLASKRSKFIGSYNCHHGDRKTTTCQQRPPMRMTWQRRSLMLQLLIARLTSIAQLSGNDSWRSSECAIEEQTQLAWSSNTGVY